MPTSDQESDDEARQTIEPSPAELRSLDVAGAELLFIRLDYQFRFMFDDFEVMIESAFQLRTAGSQVELHPEDRRNLGPALEIYPDSLAGMGIEPNCALWLRFRRGAEVRVPPSPRYEAWTVGGPGERLLICPPGGGNPIWRA